MDQILASREKMADLALSMCDHSVTDSQVISFLFLPGSGSSDSPEECLYCM